MITKKPTVLVVDDDDESLKYFSQILKKLYCEIITTNSAKSAIDILEKNSKINLIILDVIMPEMDGYELCSIIKNNPETMRIPVIFMTGLGDDISEEKGLSLGALDYIKKPISTPIAKARIKNYLELTMYESMLENACKVDALCGIPNRRAFDVTMERTLSHSRRYNYAFSCVMIDLDCFKEYNDNYGHVSGDDCLRKVAGEIKNSLPRSSDFCARYGGEEFALILPNTNLDGAFIVAAKVLENIRRLSIPHAHSKVEQIITASLGCFCAEDPSKYSEKDIAFEADMALYRAKRNGRNQISA